MTTVDEKRAEKHLMDLLKIEGLSGRETAVICRYSFAAAVASFAPSKLGKGE